MLMQFCPLLICWSLETKYSWKRSIYKATSHHTHTIFIFWPVGNHSYCLIYKFTSYKHIDSLIQIGIFHGLLVTTLTISMAIMYKSKSSSNFVNKFFSSESNYSQGQHSRKLPALLFFPQHFRSLVCFIGLRLLTWKQLC